MRKAIDGMQSRYDSLRTARKFRSASQVNDSLQRQQNALRELTNTFLGSKIEVTEMDPDLLEKAIAITAGELE